MFARTDRLLLRPGWPEDAPALAKAIGDEAIVRNLSNAPWPYGIAQANAFLATPRDAVLPSFLIMERRSNETPHLIGACGFTRRPSGAVELGYWIARPHWNRGLATEAGMALVEMARALRLARIEAAHFIDNPASGRVLEKLGFTPTGLSAERFSCARNAEAMTRLFRLDLAARRKRWRPEHGHGGEVSRRALSLSTIPRLAPKQVYAALRTLRRGAMAAANSPLVS